MNEQQKQAMRATMRQWKEDAIKYVAPPEPAEDHPTCPYHGEWVDEDGGCVLCDEEFGNPYEATRRNDTI